MGSPVSASIPGREFDLRGVAALANAAGDTTPAFELPFVVQGPWDDPIMLPDTQALIQRSPVASPLLNAVKNRNTRDNVPFGDRAADRRRHRACRRAAAVQAVGLDPAPGLAV